MCTIVIVEDHADVKNDIEEYLSMILSEKSYKMILAVCSHFSNKSACMDRKIIRRLYTKLLKLIISGL